MLIVGIMIIELVIGVGFVGEYLVRNSYFDYYSGYRQIACFMVTAKLYTLLQHEEQSPGK
jgi:hypothetical protein